MVYTELNVNKKHNISEEVEVELRVFNSSG